MKTKKMFNKVIAMMLCMTMLMGGAQAVYAVEKTTSEEVTASLDEGTYKVPVDMRKEKDGTSSSMAAAMLNKEATLKVEKDGEMKLSLNFPKNTVLMGLNVNVTGINLYDKGTETPMQAEAVTYDAVFYNGVKGVAVSDAEITLSYYAEDGLYPGKIFSDFMSAPIQIFVDFAKAEKVVDVEPPVATPPAVTPAPVEVAGDVDGNGLVELADAQMALKIALKIVTVDGLAADVDKNGVVELADAQLILKKALKIIENLND